MQIVDPIDIEDALRSDMAELLPDIAFHATPAPNDIEADSVAFMAVGGGAASPVSHEYDLGIDAWAETPGQAMALALRVQGLISSLPVRTFSSGRDYKTATANLPYNNPDPNRPLIPRCSFSATVGLRGKGNI